VSSRESVWMTADTGDPLFFFVGSVQRLAAASPPVATAQHS
jgi:hypothetical protein